jgi:hypothetical protein
MQSFFAFFMLIPAPILGIAMVENTNANNIWYHGAFLLFLLIVAIVYSCVKDSMDRY